MKVSRDSVKSLTIVISLLAIVIVIFLFLLQIGKESTTLNYNGFEFENIGGVWQTEWQRDGQLYIIAFRFNPEQVEDIPIEGRTDIRFQLENIYITIDPTEERTPETSYTALAAIELARKLTDPFDRLVASACTRNETEACKERPIITCDNTNSSVIYLKEDPEAKIILAGNCVTIQGINDEIVMAADKAIYQWLGII